MSPGLQINLIWAKCGVCSFKQFSARKDKHGNADKIRNKGQSWKFQIKLAIRLSNFVSCMTVLDYEGYSEIYIQAVILVKHLVQLLVKYLLRDRTIK